LADGSDHTGVKSMLIHPTQQKTMLRAMLWRRITFKASPEMIPKETTSSMMWSMLGSSTVRATSATWCNSIRAASVPASLPGRGVTSISLRQKSSCAGLCICDFTYSMYVLEWLVEQKLRFLPVTEVMNGRALSCICSSFL
jgi:hypothetical protein